MITRDRWSVLARQGAHLLRGIVGYGREQDMASLRLTPSSPAGVTRTDLAMMERALELARKAAAMDEVPVGAVVYRGSQIIAEGWNLREASRDPVAHAELLAVSRAGRALKEWRLSDCSLAVTLEPCPMCAGAIVNARLGRLIYGASDPKAGACRTLYSIPTDPRLNHEVEMVGGVMSERCAELLREFFQSRRERNRQGRQRGGPTARSA